MKVRHGTMCCLIRLKTDACWCVFAWLNDLVEDDGNILMPALKSLKRSNRRMARKSFFHNMFGF